MASTLVTVTVTFMTGSLPGPGHVIPFLDTAQRCAARDFTC